MKRLCCLFSGLALLLLFSSCILTDEEKALKQKIEDQEGIKKELERELTGKKNTLEGLTADLEHYRHKSEVLDKEKRAIDEYLFDTRGNIRNVFLNIQRAMQKSVDELYDCYIGNETIKRSKLLASNNVLLLDLENPAFFDMTLLEGEIFCNSPSVVTFCTVRCLDESMGTYEVVSVGPECRSEERDKKVRFKFSGRDALRLGHGEYIGLFLHAGTQLCYDAKGTGKTVEVPMDKIAPKVTFTVDSASIPDEEGRAYSFRLWGFKRSR